MTPSSARLARQAASEALGTAFLVTAVVGSGVAAQRMSPGDMGLELLENSVATGAVLAALIMALRPVSASFNPVITLAERALGRVSTSTAAALVVAQVTGGIVGAIVANLMFDLTAVSWASQGRDDHGHLIGEVVATLGLVVVVFGALRSSRVETVALAVGGYITGAYWFTSSTSFANPAVTIARTLSDTFTGIAPSSAVAFVLMQILGGGLGIALVVLIHADTAIEEAPR